MLFEEFNELELKELLFEKLIVFERFNDFVSIEFCKLFPFNSFDSSTDSFIVVVSRLTLCDHILDMLNVNIKGMAANDIEQSELNAILLQVEELVNAESVTQDRNLEKQAEIISKMTNIRDNMQREYGNLERGQ